MAGYALTEEKSKALTSALLKVSEDAAPDALLITDYGGNIIAQVSDIGDQSLQTIAALAAGSYAATRELAGMIGETEFFSVFHRGHKSSIFIQCVATNFLVLSIMGEGVTQGLMKLYIEKICRQVEPILLDVIGQSPADTDAAGTFEFDEDSAVFGSIDSE